MERECNCGLNHQIPSLGILNSSYLVVDPTRENETSENQLWIKFLRGISLFLVLAYFTKAIWTLWALAGIALIILGRLWFLQTMFKEMGSKAILVLIIPLDWLFLFKRWNVAWRSVSFQVLGILLLLVAVN